MNRKSNTPESFSTESNQVSLKRIAVVTHLKLGTFLGSPARSFQTQRENCEPMKEPRLNWPHCRHTEHGVRRVRMVRMIIDSNWLLGKATQAPTGTLLTNLFATDTVSFSSVHLYSLIIVVCISGNVFILNLHLPVPHGALWGFCSAVQKVRESKALGSKPTLVCCLFPSQPTLFKHWPKNPGAAFEWGQH